MSNRLPTIKWKMGRLRERAGEGYCSPLVWWVRETEAKKEIRELKNQKNAVTEQRDRLAEALESIVGESAYEGLPELKQLAIEEALQSLTPKDHE